MTIKRRKTQHQKDVELAKASAPRYGFYLDGGNVEKVKEAIDSVTPLVLGVINSDSSESTKQQALALISDGMTGINNCNISNVNMNVR